MDFFKFKNHNNNNNNNDDSITLESFCGECLIDIPIRAKHCKYCKKCIATYDHHCDWVGNCIGEKNKRLFIIFILNHNLELILSIILVNKNLN